MRYRLFCIFRDFAANPVGVASLILPTERKFVAYAGGEELRTRILKYRGRLHAAFRQIGLRDVMPVDFHMAACLTCMKMRNKTVQCLDDAGFARSRQSAKQSHAAGLECETDVVKIGLAFR